MITDVVVAGVSATGVQQTITAKALWDTGATGSAITPHIARTLGLTPVNRTKVTGAHDTSIVDVVKISVILPNKVMVDEINALVCNLNQQIDMLIGMDVILIGDFSISNGDGKTLFSFAVPPFSNKEDLYEKALAVKKRT
jgi:predicted aspartyl protease